MGYNAFMSVTTKWYGDKEKKDMTQAMRRTLTRGINLVQTEAKLIVPVAEVNGGTLRGSIVKAVDPVKLEATVTTNTEYAGYVEFGTSHQKAQPYLRPALTKSVPKIIAIAKQEGKKSVS